MGYGDTELGFREKLSVAIFGGLTAQQMGKVIKDTVDINHDGKVDEVEAKALAAHIKLRMEESTIPEEKATLSNIKNIDDKVLIERYKGIGLEFTPEAIKALKAELSTPLDRAAAERARVEAVKKALDKDGDGIISKKEAEDNKQFLADIAGTANNLSDADKAKLRANPKSIIADIEKTTGLKVSEEAAQVFTDTALEAANKPKKPGAEKAKEEDWWEIVLKLFSDMLGIDLKRIFGHHDDKGHSGAEEPKKGPEVIAGLDPAILAQINKEREIFRKSEIAYANSPEAAAVQTVKAASATASASATSR